MPEKPQSLYTVDYFVDGGPLAGYSDYEADEHWHRRTARTRLRRVDKALGAPGQPPVPAGRRSLVDVGAATGFFLDVAAEQGWQVAGVEASAWAAGRARSKGHRVEATLSDLTERAPVQAITFFQVLEHLPDPQAVLCEAATMLAPGGVVVCESWDRYSRTARLAGRRWQQLSPPSVLWLFTRQAMDRMAAQAGLELVSFAPTPKMISLATVAGQALAPDGSSLAARALRLVGSRIALPYALDDLVTVVMRKP